MNALHLLVTCVVCFLGYQQKLYVFFDNPFAACSTTEHSDAKQLKVTCGVCKGPLFGGILGESNPPLRNEPCLALSKRARRFKQFFSTFAACFAAFLALPLSSFAFLSSSQSSACPFLRVRFESSNLLLNRLRLRGPPQ